MEAPPLPPLEESEPIPPPYLTKPAPVVATPVIKLDDKPPGWDNCCYLASALWTFFTNEEDHLIFDKFLRLGMKQMLPPSKANFFQQIDGLLKDVGGGLPAEKNKQLYGWAETIYGHWVTFPLKTSSELARFFRTLLIAVAYKGGKTQPYYQRLLGPAIWGPLAKESPYRYKPTKGRLDPLGKN